MNLREKNVTLRKELESTKRTLVERLAEVQVSSFLAIIIKSSMYVCMFYEFLANVFNKAINLLQSPALFCYFHT